MANTGESDARYRILDKASLPAYIAQIPEVVNVLGEIKELDIVEIGDGNLNYVYRVSNSLDPAKSVIVKQAVPYLRLAGEAWPLARERMLNEIRAYSVYNRLVPDLVPKIYFADEAMCAIVMQYLDDHIVLRVGMIDGVRYPFVAEHIGKFMAETLFKTSALSMESVERRELISQFANNRELCKLTEDFIFTFPYMNHDSNYSNPTTNQWVKENIHLDDEYKGEVLGFKAKFVSSSEALLHGDLHIGSIMVNQDKSYVIDTEFAFFGPIGFDVGKVISNFIISCTSHYHRSGGAEYRHWILEQIAIIWNTFESRFIELWEQVSDSTLHTNGFLSKESDVRYRSRFMENILQEAAGFAACSIARRMIGIAGVADIRGIDNPEIRSTLEIFNLKLSKRLMSSRKKLRSIDDLLALINHCHPVPVI